MIIVSLIRNELWNCRRTDPKPEAVPVAIRGMLAVETRALKQIIISSRQARPSIQLIVIGPTGNYELILDTITAGHQGISFDLNTIHPNSCVWPPRR